MKTTGLISVVTLVLLVVGCDSEVEEGAGGGGTGASAGSGGTSSGTGGTGGTSSGGSGGSGGVSSGGAGGAGGSIPAVPECTDTNQCSLLNDCCSCLALAPGEAEPPCSIATCPTDTCTDMGFPNATAACNVGRCVAGFTCDWTGVVCAAPQPLCDPGETNSVIGACWGPCVPATECDTVTDCSQCAADEQCVEEVTQLGLRRHCVTIPSACQSTADCDCMGHTVCLPPFDTCNDSGGTISCSCPAC